VPDPHCEFCKFRWPWYEIRDLRPDGFKCTVKENAGEENTYCEESDYQQCTIYLNEQDKKI